MNQENQSFKKELAIVGGVLGLVIGFILFCWSITFIGAGTRGVVLNWGAVSDEILSEGVHFVLPIKQSVKKIDVTTLKEEKKGVEAASKDLQTVTTDVAINYRLDSEKVNILYQTLKKEWSQRVIAPTIEEYVKKTTAEYTAEELITKRDEVKENLKKSLTVSLAQNHIVVMDMFITNFQFSSQFNAAIESKVTAQQNALRAKNDLERIKMEAEQRIAQAGAEAQAIRLQSDAANSQNYIQLKALEVELEAVKKWNGVLPTTFVPDATIPFLDMK